MSKKIKSFFPEVRERAVRMVDHRGEYASLWANIE